MLGRLFGRKPKESGGPMMLFVLIPDTSPLDAAKIQDAARSKFSNLRVKATDSSHSGVEIAFDGIDLVVAHMPAPIPGGEVAQNTQISRFWHGEPTDTAHGSHLIVVAAGDQPAILRARAATRAAAAISLAHPVVGWYVGSSGQIVTPKVGIEMAEDDDSFLALWVNVIASRDSDGEWSMSTLGMEAFGHAEFEIVRATGDAGSWYTRLLDLAVYVIESGPVLKHGQTIGQDQYEKIGIEVGKSKLGKPGEVIRLRVP